MYLVLLLSTSLLLSSCDDAGAEPEKTAPKTGSQTLNLPALADPKNTPQPVTKKPLSLAPKIENKTLSPNDLAPTPNFKEIPAGQARKDAFFRFMAPLIKQANQEVMVDRLHLQEIINHFKISGADQQWLRALATKYRLKTFDPTDHQSQIALENRVDIIPVSLALAQAANESAWGTSRFARKANNYFGQWCFSKGCGLVPARRNPGAIHEVRSFKHPFYSVQSYIQNLNTHSTYKKLRSIRAKARQKNQQPSGIAMAEGLVNYSARKHEYVEALQSMIRYNKLTQYEQK